MTWTLRPYQIAAVDAVRDAWTRGHRTLIVLATGTGKTTVFAEIIRRRRDAGRGRALVIAHRIELLEQAADRLRAGGVSAELDSGASYAVQHALMGGADAVVATVQTLRGRRLERWASDAFSTIIVDEAHHSTSASYRAVLDRFPEAKILGVTATPDRGDGIGLGEVYTSAAYSYPMAAGIRDGYLAPLRCLAIDTPSIRLSSCSVTRQEHGRDYSAADLAAQLESESALHELAVPIARESMGRRTIVFVPSVTVAHELARVLAAYVGADAVRSLDGSSGTEERAAVLEQYRAGSVRFLVNCALVTEGFDAPSTSCVAIARPTQSRALYAQMVGRGTRIAPGKEDCLVLDLAPSNERHSLASPLDILGGKPLDAADVAEARAAAMTGADVMEIQRKAEQIGGEVKEKALAFLAEHGLDGRLPAKARRRNARFRRGSRS